MKKWTDLTREEQTQLLEDYKKTTGPEACKKHGVNYPSVRNILSYHHKKGMGHGGRRPNSGNKKGISFCGKCRKNLQKCKCDG